MHPVDDGGMVTVAQEQADLLKRELGVLAQQVHGDVAGSTASSTPATSAKVVLGMSLDNCLARDLPVIAWIGTLKYDEHDSRIACGSAGEAMVGVSAASALVAVSTVIAERVSRA